MNTPKYKFGDKIEITADTYPNIILKVIITKISPNDQSYVLTCTTTGKEFHCDWKEVDDHKGMEGIHAKYVGTSALSYLEQLESLCT